MFDISIKVYYQLDFKKLIAYMTVQEMTLLVLLLFFTNNADTALVIKFTLFHILISGALFFINELLYLRFGTRNLSLVTNLWVKLPVLSGYIYLLLLIFNGIPLTIKFFLELLILLKFCNTN
jgi:NADH:ubiquinone oxidoreductase subunit 4 (subunit M)